MRQSVKKRVIIKLFLLLLIVFLSYNLFWLGSVYKKYVGYAAGMEAFHNEKINQFFDPCYSTQENKMTYSVQCPEYLSLDGNLAVSKGDLLLIIWPSIFGDTEYGLKKNSLARSYEVMVNERMEPIDPNDASLIEPDVASFNKLMQAAKLKWETF